MDWLNDKKNQPIIATIAALVILVVAGVMFFKMRGGSSNPPPTDVAATAPSADPSMVGTQPTAAPTAPATAPAAGATTTAAVASGTAKPMESWRSDPFLPIDYKPPTVKQKPIPRIVDFPFVMLPKPVSINGAKADPPEPQQPVRRMAGILINGRVFAILETEGKSQVYQPGDILEDRLATVERIEADKVILKTRSKHPRYLTVRMASAPKTGEDPGSENSGPQVGPMGPMGPMAPPGGMIPMPGMAGGGGRR